MMKISQYTISGTTDASGDATVYTNKPVRGKIIAIACDVDALAATADTTITGSDLTPNQTILTLTNVNTNGVYYPRTPAHDNVGAAVTFDGTNEIYTEFIHFGRIKAVVAQGGATKAFELKIYVEEY